MRQKNQPPVLAAMNERKEYHKPSFEVINLSMESSLLTSSGTPTSKKTPDVNPFIPGRIW